MQSHEESWSGAREEIFKIILTAQICSEKCQHCNQREATIRCAACIQNQDLCFFCDDLVHQKEPLHDRRAWIDGSYISISPTQCLAEDSTIITVGRNSLLLVA